MSKSPAPRSALALLVISTAGCFAVPGASGPASSAEISSQQRAAFAQSMGYPTKKSPQELEAAIAQQTKGFVPRASKRSEGRLEAPLALTIEGVERTCYTVVLRLGASAHWGLGAEAGLRFDFQSPTSKGSGGPGLIGPGAVASVGCAEANGPIVLTMAPLVGTDPIGQGPFTLELWSRTLTKEEVDHLQADKQRQIAEQREFAAREAAKQEQRETRGCAKCDARYQGCIGGGRGSAVCRQEYGSCAFEEVGANYLSACPNPR
jgi:hypothetical protein